MNKHLVILFSFLISGICMLFSCGDGNKKEFRALVEEWKDKEILFPRTNIFVNRTKDTVDFSAEAEYKILSYVDTIGCISCKLQLSQWKRLVEEVDSLDCSVKFLFYFSPEKEADVYRALRTDRFEYPVCIDVKDSLNKLNHFPSNMMLQTFLLDRHNKVIAIGNPIHNPEVKELYLRIIRGEQTGQEAGGNGKAVTKVGIDKATVSMGTFNWQEEQKTCFRLRNTGGEPLVIMQVNTSCDCTTVDYSQEPVPPGKEAVLTVTYKADNPGYFERTVTVYCNTESSPVQLSISGDAQ